MSKVAPNDRKIPSRQRMVKLTNQRPNAKATFQSQSSSTETIVSEKDTPPYLQQLIKKIFYPNSQCNEYKDALPALTSSSEVDLQLYSLIGLLFKLFVHSWYQRLTDDHEFLDEIVDITAHITRNLETRLKRVDLIQLLLDDVPLILNDHLEAYRKIHEELGSRFLPDETMDKAMDHIYNHFALMDDDETVEADYLKVLSKNVLNYLLPHDDLNSTLVEEFMKSVLSDLLLKNIIEKIIQPYQIFEIISIACEFLIDQDGRNEVKEDDRNGLTNIQTFFSQVIDLVSKTIFVSDKKRPTSVNVYSLSIFSFLNNLFQINNTRPVLYAFIKSTTPIASQAPVNDLLNNLIQNTLVKSLRNESLIALIIQKLRNNLFPSDDEMGPPRIVPDLEEFEKIRKTTKDNLKSVCNKFKLLSNLVIASESELDDTLDDFLTTFENKRMNKNLVYRILDLIVIKLIPELCGMQL